jgi:hypothetical protein
VDQRREEPLGGGLAAWPAFGSSGVSWCASTCAARTGVSCR